MDLWVREARLFKYGSGTGSNFSALRGEGERLSGGGKSSGLMSFLKIGDRAAGAIKSGGTTRRAAKMVVVDIDHPDIETYINWKVKEEQKVAALVTGSKIVSKHLKAIMKAAVNCEGNGDDCFDVSKNPALKREVKAAKKALVPENYIQRVIQFARQGYTDMEFPIYDTDWDSEAYLTVSGQNSNNSVRVTDDFLKAVETDGDWQLKGRVNRKADQDPQGPRPLGARSATPPGPRPTPASSTTPPSTSGTRARPPARSSRATRARSTCSSTTPRATSPRSTCCPTATPTARFDVAGFEHTCRLWTIVLEISVMMAQFPSQGHRRALVTSTARSGIGYANIGGLLMTSGIPYDSAEGRAIAGAITAVMTGVAYATSAEMAGELGAFGDYKRNAKHMLRVIRNHRNAAHGNAMGYEGLSINPVPLDHASLKDSALGARAKATWDEALALGEKHGYRNAQVSVIAPTGTIGLVMDCDTTGIEPDFALVKFKKLAGGGYFKIINRAVPPALRTLGYSESRDRRDRGLCRRPRQPQPGARRSTRRRCAPRASPTTRSPRSTPRPKSAFDIKFIFNQWTLGADFLKSLGVTDAQLADSVVRPPRPPRLLASKDIEAANIHVCGAMTLEGAPHLKAEHLPVFDCASPAARSASATSASNRTS